MAVLLPLPIPIPVDGVVDPVKQREYEIEVEMFCIARPSIIKDLSVALQRSDTVPFIDASVALHKRLVYEEDKTDIIVAYLVKRGLKCMREYNQTRTINYIKHPRTTDVNCIFKKILENYKLFLYTIRCLNASSLPHQVCKIILDKVYDE
jgi:hypothetical protein